MTRQGRLSTRRARPRTSRQSNRHRGLCGPNGPTVGRSSPVGSLEESLWKHERDEVLRYYPGALLLPSRKGWRVVMDPIPPRDELLPLLEALHSGREVSVGLRGRARSAESSSHELSAVLGESVPALVVPRRPYIVELQYPATTAGPAGPVHPKASVLQPEMSIRSYPGHPHMNLGPRDDSWPCPVSPHVTSWSWRAGATWWYLAQVALWIVKTEVWGRTGGGISSWGLWLGDAESHAPTYVVQAVRHRGPCRCGTGKSYKDCHLESDLATAAGYIDVGPCYWPYGRYLP